MSIQEIEAAIGSLQAAVRYQEHKCAIVRRTLLTRLRRELRVITSIEIADAFWRLCPLRSTVRKDAKRKAARLVVEARKAAMDGAASLAEARLTYDRPIRPYIYGESYGQIHKHMVRRSEAALKAATSLEDYVNLYLYGYPKERDKQKEIHQRITALSPSVEELRRVRRTLGCLPERFQWRWNRLFREVLEEKK